MWIRSSGGVDRALPVGAAEQVSVVNARERIEYRHERIMMLYQDGLLLEGGKRVRLRESFYYEGTEEILSVSCAKCGVVVFNSGKRVRF